MAVLTPASRAKRAREEAHAGELVFVVSVCDGVGAIFEALQQMGCTFAGHSCEREQHLRKFVAAKWPFLSSSSDVRDLRVDGLADEIKKAGPTCVVLSGGPPCTPFSCLGAERGFGDENSEPLTEFFRLRDALSAFCRDNALRFLWLMEEVASMTRAHRDAISELAGATPVLMHAADFGYVHRARLYWGIPEGCLRSSGAVECFPEGAAAEGIKVVRWLGKPSPAAWEPDGGFGAAHLGTCGTRATLVPGTGFAPTFPTGRFLAFTTVFPHPADRPPKDAKDDPFVYQRFLDDERRLPLFHYAKGNLVWRDGEARPLSAEEREQLMGFPRGFTEALDKGPHRSAEDARGHAMGNTFHVPCVIVLLLLLFADEAAAEPGLRSRAKRARLCGRSSPLQWEAPLSRAQRKAWADSHRRGTVWEDGDEWPRPRWSDGAGLLEEALRLFPRAYFPGRSGQQPIDEALASARACDLTPLHFFDRHLRKCGAPLSMTGPDIQALWAKSPMHAAVARQHRPSAAVSGEPNMVQPGLGPQGHIDATRGLEHPFARDAPLEVDLQFVTEAYVALGLDVVKPRQRALAALGRLAEAVSCLDDAARAWRPIAIDGAPGVRPVFVAVLVTLLRWPDTDLPMRLIEGFQLGGEIPISGVLRPVPRTQVGAPVEGLEEETLLGPAAAQFVDDLEARPCRFPVDPAPFEATVKEIEAGLADPVVPRWVMDAKFGRGGWRPLPRHVIQQHSKSRPIDDGKAARTNALSLVGESNVCIPPELLVLVARRLAEAFVGADGSVPPWFDLRGSLEDWWKGYRQMSPTAEHLSLAVAAVRVPPGGRWGYSQLRGLPFGLGAAVNQFVRMPMLLSAAARRLLLLLCGHYVDDNGVLELAALGTSAADAFRKLAEDFMGVKLSDEKRRPPASLLQFLGHLHDFRPAAREYAIVYEPRLGLREEVSQAIQEALDGNFLAPGDAAKIRGKAQFLDTGLAGKPCRGALSAVADRQYGRERGAITEACALALRFLQAVCSRAVARTVELSRRPQTPVIVYTDASSEDSGMRLGMLVFHPETKPQAMVYDVPECTVAPWRGEGQGINQGELYAANVLAWSAPDLLRGQDVIWFIDNTSAESALVKSGSATPSMSRLALQAAAFFAALGARVWFEHVPSEDNPADALSRDGFDDPWVRAELARGRWLRRPCSPPPPADDFVGAWDLLATLG